jgi:hypothetical protein
VDNVSEIHRGNGEFKSDDGRNLDEVRLGLIEQLKTKSEAPGEAPALRQVFTGIENLRTALKERSTSPAPILDARDPASVSVRPIVTNGRQKTVNAELARAANCSEAHVRLARRIYRRVGEDLVVAVMLNILPVGTAARAGIPKRPNRFQVERDRLVGLLVNEGGQ